jgi:4-aminobutyrate aminotransferase-like enzyme/Ser/Thr protein kinase RdoA (MazF antagonist)
MSQPTSPWRQPAPQISAATAVHIAAEAFATTAKAEPLDSYIDSNFLLTTADGTRLVLKIANQAESRQELDLQALLMQRLADELPGIAPLQVGELVQVVGEDGRQHWARLATYLPGELLADHHHAASAETWRQLGEKLAQLDLVLADCQHPAQHRALRWNLSSAMPLVLQGSKLWTADQRALALAAASAFCAHVTRRIDELPQQLIHNDANEFNLLVAPSTPPEITGIFDFGDVVFAPRIFEIAVAGAYVAIGGVEQDPQSMLRRVAEVAAGYHRFNPLTDAEWQALFPAMLMRLALSVTISSRDAEFEGGNEYITVNQSPAWNGLQKLLTLSPMEARSILQSSVGDASGRISNHLPQEDLPPQANCRSQADSLAQADLIIKRKRHTGKSLSISYTEPLTIQKGRGAWLFDETDRGYLDGVNNVCHVGHCHPQVVAAAQNQIAALNTNTRYLHPHLARYAERLTGLFPDPLNVCFFVNSGSEANELALRLARNFTGRRNILAMEGGYHGNTGNLIDISHYKHAGPGGNGPPDWVRTVPCPDSYRGRYHAKPAQQQAQQYAQHVADAADGFEPAAFLFEPLIGCGGQIIPPPGYWTAACQHARDAGAVVIADEVQVGFGRVGSHWWAHQLDDEHGGAQPEIVTLGKPIGNGHPMAAVITSTEIADAFANGMEYFNTFGGNPVSCAVGMAVLDVIEDQQLLSNATAIGEQLQNGLRELAEQFPVIGDVRGAGLYLGAEFIQTAPRLAAGISAPPNAAPQTCAGPTTQPKAAPQPNAARLTAVLDHCKSAGLLFSSDGPDHNVLKIKPPMIWSHSEADLALASLEQALHATQPTTS